MPKLDDAVLAVDAWFAAIEWEHSFVLEDDGELIAASPEADVVALMYETAPPVASGKAAGVMALVAAPKHGDAKALVASLSRAGMAGLVTALAVGAFLRSRRSGAPASPPCPR